MRRRTRDLPAAGGLRCFGVAVMLAAPLLVETANAIAATSPAGNAPVISARNVAAPDTAVTAHAAMRYPRAFIERKLSARSPQQCA